MLSLRPLIKLAPQVRPMSVITGPPANPMGTVEKLCHGLVMGISCLSLPAYVLTNMRRYRGLE